MDYNYYDYDRQSYQNSESSYGSGSSENANGSDPYWKPEGNPEPKHRKKSGFGKVVAMAVVFGLIAGGTAFGVNAAARSLGTAATAISKEASGSGTTKLKTSSGGTSGTGSSTAGDTSVSAVASKAMPAMVTISTMSVEEMQNYFGQSSQYEVSGAGTGVIVGEDDDEYLIATNEHVVSGAQKVSVGFIDESVASASLKGTDSDQDLAVIAVNKSDLSDDTVAKLSIIEIGDSDSLELGQRVVAIGNALGYGQSVTSGYISALNRSMTTSDGATSEGLIQTDAAINPGNSGGALLDMDGKLVGINEGKSSSSNGTTVDNMGYAIPMAKAEPILNELMQQKTKTVIDEDERGYLGISGADVTSQYSEVYNMPVGVCVIAADEGSAAANAGLKKGDVITKVEGQKVSTLEELREQLQYYKSGETIELTAQRSDDGEYKEQTFRVTLESKETLEKSASAGSAQQGSEDD